MKIISHKLPHVCQTIIIIAEGTTVFELQQKHYISKSLHLKSKVNDRDNLNDAQQFNQRRR